MVVAVLTARLALYESTSLKDKRRVIRGVKDRLRSRHNVSVAEVGNADARQHCELAIALVSNDRRFSESCLYKIVDELRCVRQASLIDYEVEYF